MSITGELLFGVAISKDLLNYQAAPMAALSIERAQNKLVLRCGNTSASL
jgi:hypothetical protein